MKVHFMGLLLVAALVASARAGLAAEATIEQRLVDLERRLEVLAQENADLRRRLDVPVERSVAVPIKPAGNETSLAVGGFLQGQAEFGGASDPRWSGTRDRLFFRRARFHVAGTFAEHFDFKAELDFQGNTLGASTGNVARANEIFINWNRFDELNLRMGQLKPAFGAEALASDTKCFTVERSLSNDRLTDGRQLAVGAAGSFFDKQLAYYATLADGNGANVSANDNDKFQRALRLVWTPRLPGNGGKLTLGLNGLWSEDSLLTKSDFGFSGNSFTGRRSMSGVDLFWTHGRLDFNAEFLRGRFDPSGTASPAQQARGWQATAAFFVVPAKLQLVVRREAFDPNTALGGDTSASTTLGVNYFLKGDDIKFMLNVLSGHSPKPIGDSQRVLSRVQVAF